MFTKMCILCLTNNSRLQSILSKDSDGLIIDEKLKFFISKQIKIEPEDSMLYICLPCLEKLNNVYNYKQLCLKNISKFNSFILKYKSTDEPCINLQVTLIDIKDSNINEVNSDSTTTEYCKVDNPYEDETKHEQKPEIFAKENIEIRSINISDDAAQEENVIKEEVVEENEMKYEFVDVFIKEEPRDKSDDDIDVKSDLQNDPFLNETDNIAESTSKNSPNRQSDLVKHKRCHTADKKYKCDVCQKEFTLQSYLVSHQVIHTGEKLFKCEVCNKTFSRQSSLVKHKRCHTGDKPYKCDVCNKAFNQSSNLMIHKRLHTGEKPYKCDVCHKAFTHQSHLVSHKLTHTGDKPYKCDVCDKAFYQNSNLVTHKRCHTGERPYKCNECDKRFNHQSHLVSHRLTHSSTKSFECDVCNKAFKRSSALMIHKRCHTGDKPYKCDVCAKSFKHSSSLVKHKLCHTGENV